MQSARAISASLLRAAALATIVAGTSTYLLSAEPAAQSRPPLPRAALIATGLGNEQALVEAAVIANERAAWLERAEVHKLLEEQVLQAIFSPAEVGQRARLGKLLKADLLVLLRSVPEKGDTKPHLELVVCETGRGLRLCRHVLPDAGSAKEITPPVIAAINGAIDKHAERIEEICAVPPFLSEDLLDEHDYLKQSYARVMEQTLLGQKGLLVVELSEARALASELELVGAKGELSRQLPLYFVGSFRNHAGKGEQRKVELHLEAKRGATLLDKLPTAKLAPEAVSEYLRRSTVSLLKSAGREVTAGDRNAEAKQLANRAQEFSETGQWIEAVDLYEASLLLDPDNLDALRRQQRALLFLEYWFHTEWSNEYTNAQKALTFLNYHRRAMNAAAGIYRLDPKAAELSPYDVLNVICSNFSTLRLLPDELPATVEREFNEAIRQKKELLLGIVRRVVEHPNAYLRTQRLDFLGSYLANLPGCEHEAIRSAIAIVAEKPGAKENVVAMGRQLLWVENRDYPQPAGFPRLGQNVPPSAPLFQFVDELAASPNASVREAATELSRRFKTAAFTPDERRKAEAEYSQRLSELVAKREADSKKYAAMKAAAAAAPQIPQPEEPPEPPHVFRPMPLLDPEPLKVPAPPPLQPEFVSNGVRFRPIWFYSEPVTEPGATMPDVPAGNAAVVTEIIDEIIPVGTDVDVVVHNYRQKISLLRDKGRLQPISLGRHWVEGIVSVVYDGELIWVTTKSTGETNPIIAIIDLKHKQTWNITDKDGLPFPKLDRQGPGAAIGRGRMLTITPLAPGKVCAVGSFGRTWIGTIRFDPARGAKVEILHQSKKLPAAAELGEPADDWKDINVGFNPAQMFAFRDGSDKAAHEPRFVLIVRSDGMSAKDYPILCDLKDRTCQVIDQKIVTGGRFAVGAAGFVHHDEMLYVLATDGQLTRYSCPRLSGTLVAKLPPFQSMFSQGSLFHLGTSQWVSGRLVDGRIDLRAEVPWRPSRNQTPPKDISFSLTKACLSNQFGVVAICDANHTTAREVIYYQVVLPKSLNDAAKKPAEK